VIAYGGFFWRVRACPLISHQHRSKPSATPHTTRFRRKKCLHSFTRSMVMRLRGPEGCWTCRHATFCRSCCCSYPGYFAVLSAGVTRHAIKLEAAQDCEKLRRSVPVRAPCAEHRARACRQVAQGVRGHFLMMAFASPCETSAAALISQSDNGASCICFLHFLSHHWLFVARLTCG
jgi:hypothetical protein